MFNPTPEQAAIIAFATANPTTALGVDAKAGSGKTATILAMLPRLRGQNLLLAYNKSIQRELETRISAMDRLTSHVSTVHAFGLGALKRSGAKPKVEGGKVNFLLRDILAKSSKFRGLFNERLKGTATISKFVGIAKSAGLGIDGFPPIDAEDVWMQLADHFSIEDDLIDVGIDLSAAIELSISLLEASNRASGSIDFDDMIYLPLLQNLPIPAYQNVIIDEAQDISKTRAELATRACANGRMIFVGDPHQAIYGFTGADAEAMPNLTRQHAATILPLSICFRCDEAIITEAQRYVPGIYPRDKAGPGTVIRDVPVEDLFDPAKQLPQLGDAFLCRLNRPNVAVALELLRLGHPVKIEGRDLGENLLGHLKKSCPLYASTTIFELFSDVEDYRELRIGELMRRNKQGAVALLQDELDALILLMERASETGGTNYLAVEMLVKNLFADDISPRNLITLSSIHKAKGREWPRVFILGAGDYMPFFMAKKDWELVQEANLSYVAITRAETCLTYIEGVKEWLDLRAKR